jgi:hypothetical protein
MTKEINQNMLPLKLLRKSYRYINYTKHKNDYRNIYHTTNMPQTTETSTTKITTEYCTTMFTKAISENEKPNKIKQSKGNTVHGYYPNGRG